MKKSFPYDCLFQLWESLIDFAQPDLPSEVWDKDANRGYKLAEDAERKILDTLRKYPEDLLSIAKEMHIVGSLTSNQYLEDSDLDVHIVPKDLSAWDDKKVSVVVKWFINNRDKLKAYIGKHPIEVYIQTNVAQDYLSPGIFDFITKKWIKGPKIVPSNYDPYEDFSDIAGELRNSVKDADLLFGELKRDIIDYETIKAAMGKMSSEDKKSFLVKLEAKMKEIEKDVDSLFLKRKEWIDARHTATKPLVSVEQALRDVSLAHKWRDANALFKLIHRYQYLSVIKDLKDIISDEEEITPDEIDKIKGVMGARDVSGIA